MKFNWFRRQQREEELNTEIQQHLDEVVRDRMERGESAEQARINARREFGSVGLIKEVTREMWGWASLERLGQDLRFGVRMLMKSPGFTAVAVLTLALGIGANTAIFSVVNAVLLRALPYRDADRLVTVWEKNQSNEQNTISPANFFDWQAQNRVFEGMAAFADTPGNLAGDGAPVAVSGQRVTDNLFSVLGVNALLGRTFTPEDSKPGQNNVVILSFGLWQRRYGRRAERHWAQSASQRG